MSAHTPGPWFIQDTRGVLLSVVSKPYAELLKRKLRAKAPAGDYLEVCNVAKTLCRTDGKGRFTHPDLPEGQALANARLVSAAPELLSALEACLRDCDSKEEIHPRSRITLSMATQQMAREAIAKAKGTK